MHTSIMHTISNSVRRCLFPFLLYLLIPLNTHARVDFFCTGAQMGMGVLADSLFLGASFIYLGSEPGASVAIINSDAEWEGSLYFMVPGFPDSAYYLFTNKPANHPNDPTRVNLSMIFDIPVGSIITFKYVVSGYQPLYTGENRPGIDQYVSNVSHSSQGVLDDRRWCTAGRIKDANGQPTDSAEFTFEDAPNGDFDFNDIIFRVKGLGLNIEDTIPRTDSAIVYDAVGNGIGDSLVIFFDFVDTFKIINVDLIWPQAAPVQQLDLTPLHLESPRIISIPYTPVSQEVVTQGTGEVTVGLDSLNLVVAYRKCDALDGIGPLLKDEALLVRRYIPDNDTFFVSFTENVAVSEIMGTSFILIKKDTHREIELTLLDPAVALGSQDSITFAIADLGSDAPEAGDSLKILHTGPVVDTPRRNHAHPDNTPVPIVLIDRPTQVNVVTGYYFDNDAEGYVDSIYVEATTNLPGGLTDVLVQELIDNALTLPAFRGFTVNSSGVTNGGFFIKVTEDNTQNHPITDVTLEDKLTVSAYMLSIGANVTAATADIIDKVAPIIHWEPKSALLADYQVASRSDTLGVKFSEPVENVTADEPFYFLDTDNNSNYSVTLLPVSQPKSDSMVFHVVSVSGVAEMKDGDSLWIHETDLVTDVEGNYQNNTANIKRRLYVEKIYGSVHIVKGYYFDNNADGFVDSIFVEVTTDISGGLTDAHVQEIIESAITLPDYRNFTVNGSGVVSGGFYIDVEEVNDNPTTYVKAEDILEVSETILTSGEYVPATTAPIYDRVAPLIHWEDKAAYLIDYQVDSIADTLTVKFSENITDVTHEEPFLFLSMEENTQYNVQLSHVSHTNDVMKFTVDGFNPVKYIRDGDSIWIQQTDRVGDNVDPINYQNNNNNTKRRLWVERRLVPYILIPNSTSPINISNPNSNTIIPSDVIDIINTIDPNFLINNGIQINNNGDYIGMIITIKPNKDPEIMLPDFELKGFLTIFDAVGNQIVSKAKMLWWEEQKALIHLWNGKNMNDRNVGAGSYLAIAEIEEVTESLGYQNSGPKQVKRIYIGVRE